MQKRYRATQTKRLALGVRALPSTLRTLPTLPTDDMSVFDEMANVGGSSDEAPTEETPPVAKKKKRSAEEVTEKDNKARVMLQKKLVAEKAKFCRLDKKVETLVKQRRLAFCRVDEISSRLEKKGASDQGATLHDEANAEYNRLSMREQQSIEVSSAILAFQEKLRHPNEERKDAVEQE